MVSLELARELRQAGLEWEPKFGDMFVVDYDNGLGPTPLKVVYVANFGPAHKEEIWLPRLDQLLAGIEARGYRWKVAKLRTHTLNNHYVCAVFGNGIECNELVSKIPEDAAAKALLWILERGKDNGC